MRRIIRRPSAAQRKKWNAEGERELGGKRTQVSKKARRSLVPGSEEVVPLDFMIDQSRKNQRTIVEWNEGGGVSNLYGDPVDTAEEARDVTHDITIEGLSPEEIDRSLQPSRAPRIEIDSSFLKTYREDLESFLLSFAYDYRAGRVIDIKDKILRVEELLPEPKVEGPSEGLSVSVDFSNVNKFLNAYNAKGGFSSKDLRDSSEIIFAKEGFDIYRQAINDLLEESYGDFIEDYNKRMGIGEEYVATLLECKGRLDSLVSLINSKKEAQIDVLKNFHNIGYFESGKLVAMAQKLLTEAQADILKISNDFDTLSFEISDFLKENKISQWEIPSQDIGLLEQASSTLMQLMDDNNGFYQEFLRARSGVEQGIVGIREGFLHVTQIDPTFEAQRIYTGGFRTPHPQLNIDLDRTEATYDLAADYDSIDRERLLAESYGSEGKRVRKRKDFERPKPHRRSITLGGEGSYSGGVIFLGIRRGCSYVIDKIGEMFALLKDVSSMTAYTGEYSQNIFRDFQKSYDKIKNKISTGGSFVFDSESSGEDEDRTIKYMFSVSDNVIKDLRALGINPNTIDEIRKALSEGIFGRPDLIPKLEDFITERIIQNVEGL